MEQTLVNGIADNLLHNIFNDLSVGLELYDKDGLMIDVNYSRLRSMGIKDKKDILGYNLFNYTSFSDEIKEQIRKGETVRFMAKYDFDDLCRLFPTNLSGIKFFEITVSFVHNDKSEITNYMVITQDITERVLWQNKYDNLYEEVVRSKKELLESEQRMIHLIRQNELVLNNINSGLAYIANDYIVQWENISLCSKSLSYEAYKKGEPCYLTAHNRTTPCENCVMQRARKSGQVESILFNLDNKHVIEVFATPIFNEQGDVDGVVIRVDDVTERQHMIGELEKARSRAEQSDKLKSAFLANMSHEIRTPLNAIVGFSDLLMVTEDQEEKEEFIQIINANNELLLKLINDILDLSKIEAGSVELKYEDFDLAVYFNELAASMHRRVVNPQVRLVPMNPYETCTVRLDKNRLAQILTNFVTNAIKYTSEGMIEMGYEKVGGSIRLYVRDTGIGIPEDKKDKVFHRFEKLDEFAQGTGLGLSICKAIVEACRGEIGFESEFDKGSLFWAILPCQFESVNSEPTSSRRNNEKDANGDKENIPDSEVAKKAPKRVLVVEDIQSNFFLVSSILKNKCQLLHAPNGLEAVEIVRTQPVDLVLMDMKMPVMDGRIATSEIRKFNTEIPIIALTAHAFDADRVAALKAGCDDYLVKPINGAKLMQTLKEYGC
ncbi:Signal transduction histidine kinase [Bacteroides ovatus]|uniref:histidine kinase n=2 Tax=Pseudomonadati TaxID=3379134 RepID=A0A1G6GC89_BACOV|nr:response regulator [Bacteroides ovatus]SDB79584.1 Signal transduction histidine kinase [Bacteroides ovatus]